MNDFEYIKSNHECKNHDSIVAPKVFDQCRQRKCIELGPAVSAEKCTCIIIPPDSEENLSRVVLPNRPVYLPELVSCVKVISDSFKAEKVQVTGVTPSLIKKGYWDVEVLFSFIYKIQLFDVNMKKFKILCCACDCESINDSDSYKDYILCSAQYIYTVTLFGSSADSFLTFSDLPFQQELQSETPHVLGEIKTYLIDACIRSPEGQCDCEEIPDGIYDEVVIYIYIRIGILINVKLVRLINLLIESCGYDRPESCKEFFENPCELFEKLDFPESQFFPQNKV